MPYKERTRSGDYKWTKPGNYDLRQQVNSIEKIYIISIMQGIGSA